MPKHALAAISILIVSAASFIFTTREKSALPVMQSENQGGPENDLFSHPLIIEKARSATYPGSQIVIEQKHASTSAYTQFIVSYHSEGLKIFGLLSIPNSPMPGLGYPAIIFNHGWIRPSEYKTTERYIEYFNTFARNGYVVFKPDYRGHGNSEGIAEGAYFSDAYTADVLNALASVKQMKEVNPQKLGMWGHSMGGYLTLRSMVIVPDIKAGVVWGGVVADYEDIIFNWTRGDRPNPTDGQVSRRRQRQEEFFSIAGSREDSIKFWDAISPINFVNKVAGPIQIHHGLEDETVPFEFSKSLEEKLLAEGKEVEAFYYENGNHNLSGPAFIPAITRSLQFFDGLLK